MDYERFIQEVEVRGGFKARVPAVRATTATLSALGQELVEDEALAAARSLPESFGQLLRAAPQPGALGLDELYRRVSEAEGVALGVAVEHAQIVCQVLAEALDGETRFRLQKHLPVELASLLTPRPPFPMAPLPERKEAPAPPGAGPTLATGRPGSQHPVSEAHPATAQERSVVNAENPHAETKLSSSHGTTQERRAETLATGAPGSRRPLHSAKR